jgi:hypothetical protein
MESMTHPGMAGGRVTIPLHDMGGLEHALDTLFVPPLLDDRVLLRFCRAVETYAATQGGADAATVKLGEMRAALQSLVDLGSLCRLAARGDSRSFARMQDELECLAVDFPDPPLEMVEHDMGPCDPDPRTQLAAAVDLFAAAAFVSKGDPARLSRYVTAIVRAIENAVAFPLAFADEAAAYVGEGDGTLAPPLATVAVANAALRLLRNDTDCTPAAPVAFCARLEGLAARWIEANPVSGLFELLTGPSLKAPPFSLSPGAAQVGETVTIKLERGYGVRDDSLVVMCCPHLPARILNRREKTVELDIEVPEGARSGPVALVEHPSPQGVEQLVCLIQQYQADYPVEWALSGLGFIPLDEWCYPVAFTDAPRLEVVQVPRAATVAVFDTLGRRAEGRMFKVGDTATITFRVHPVGSEANAPLEVHATKGTVTVTAKPHTLLYRPTQPGTGEIRLSWGSYCTLVRVVAGAAR